MYQTIPANVLLTAWERSYAMPPVKRALLLFSLARPGETLSRLADCSIGERDGALLNLRAGLFGREVQSLDVCPECNEKVEVLFSVDDVLIRQVGTGSSADRLGRAGRTLRVRPVSSNDLLEIERIPAGPERRRTLLRRCVRLAENVNRSGAASCQLELDADEALAVTDALAALDPQSDIQMAMRCSKCHHTWKTRFEIAAFLWAEINAWAERLLAEIHTLGSAYGWSEQDILEMSAWRRQIYLGMLRQ
jgi:hypothetical protein